MICPPARFWMGAVKLDPTVLEKTPSEPAPVAWMIPLLVSLSLLPCMYTTVLELPLVVSVLVFTTTPFWPRMDTARALLPLVVTAPLFVNMLLACPVLVWPQAADIP